MGVGRWAGGLAKAGGWLDLPLSPRKCHWQTLSLSLSLLPNPQGLLQPKRSLLQQCNLLQDTFVLTKTDLMPNVLLTVLQVFVMDKKAFTEFAKSPALLGSDFDPDDTGFIAGVYSLMGTVVVEKLKAYAAPEGTLRQEMELIAEAERVGDYVRKCILYIRMQERRMLLELKNSLLEELKSMEEDTDDDAEGEEEEEEEEEEHMEEDVDMVD